MGGELRAFKIKPVLFLYALGFLAATKILHKRNEKLNNERVCFTSKSMALPELSG